MAVDREFMYIVLASLGSPTDPLGGLEDPKGIWGDLGAQFRANGPKTMECCSKTSLSEFSAGSAGIHRINRKWSTAGCSDPRFPRAGGQDDGS